MRTLKKLLYIVFLLILAGTLVAFGYYFAVTKDVALAPQKLLLSEKNITLYDKDLERIQGVSVCFDQTVNVDKLSDTTVHAFVDTEDKRFFTHNGFDYKRIAKAFLNNAKTFSFKEGASTISQQLIKNTHLSQEKTLKRKLQEWKLTRTLERNYSKTEILEKYLNTIYFGHNCFGLYSASEFYFGKSPDALTLGEAAVLAGLVKSPNNYSPFKNPQKCLSRKIGVLTAMQRNGSITAQEKATATAETLPDSPSTVAQNDGYLQFVFDELTEIAETKNFTVGGNIEIYTYLDKALQQETETIAKNVGSTDISVVIADTERGGFKAAYSSLGNVPRLPGSLIKPLAVYAPALEEGLLSPATPVLDDPVDYHGYRPENYDKKYHGYVSVRECVAKSLNIPAVKTLSALGTKKSAEYLRKMRLTVPEDDLSLSLALGGMKNGFSLTDLVQAYCVFPNEGEFSLVGFIDKIVINGTTVYRKEKQEQRVFGKDTSYLMTDMLCTAAKQGTAKKLRGFDFDIAAKTGTVGTKVGNTDAYALSFTSKDCLGVHLGKRDNGAIEETGGGKPCDVLLALNRFLYDTQPPDPFSVPNGVRKVRLDKHAYYDTHTLELADELSPKEYQFSEWFKTSAIPQKQSTAFSNPCIAEPKISVKDGKVTLSFEEDFTHSYHYKIERTDYATHSNYVKHSTLYSGEYLSEFIDENIQDDIVYQYSITPFYKNHAGVTVTLPRVTSASNNPPSILEKDWWNR